MPDHLMRSERSITLEGIQHLVSSNQN